MREKKHDTIDHVKETSILRSYNRDGQCTSLHTGRSTTIKTTQMKTKSKVDNPHLDNIGDCWEENSIDSL